VKITCLRFAVFLISASLTAASTSAAFASPHEQHGTPPQAPPGPHRVLDLAPMTLPGLATVQPEATTAIPAWSRLVFQSYRDTNWEIYRADADGSSQVRVTNSPASVDYAPRLNPDASRIAFASDRNGPDYDIFVVDWNGAGLAALTANSADDVAPAWSPDGSMIVFESYRDGQAEVYRMTLAGGMTQRLTTHPAYDGTSVWSPDGTQIAFTSRRTGTYQVWVMDADGTNQRALTNLPNAYDPAWSPDSSQIAFDADGDGDGFEELWLMSADGSGQRQIYDPPQSNQTAWARSWSADGRYVAFSRLTFEGQYTTETIIAAWDSLAPNPIVRLSPGDRDLNPDWQATEHPDLWVTQARGSALPGQQVDLELAYGNQGSVAARNARITANLPAGLVFVNADPPPNATSPVLQWNKSSLPATGGSSRIRITVRVEPSVPVGTTLPTLAKIVSSSSELVLDNNTASAAVHVGWSSYLPLVSR
jgi:uncharacterized repeat protein (TIGR01451 family)